MMYIQIRMRISVSLVTLTSIHNNENIGIDFDVNVWSNKEQKEALSSLTEVLHLQRSWQLK